MFLHFEGPRLAIELEFVAKTINDSSTIGYRFTEECIDFDPQPLRDLTAQIFTDFAINIVIVVSSILVSVYQRKKPIKWAGVIGGSIPSHGCGFTVYGSLAKAGLDGLDLDGLIDGLICIIY